jgi:hypothetical protein
MEAAHSQPDLAPIAYHRPRRCGVFLRPEETGEPNAAGRFSDTTAICAQPATANATSDAVIE